MAIRPLKSNKMKATILFFTLFSAVSAYGTADKVIRGTITDHEGKPIEAVVVKIQDGAKILSYTTSAEDGSYKISYNLSKPLATLRFEHLSYQPLTQIVNENAQTLNIVLQEKRMELKEVTISAPVISQRNDTLSYRLSAFAGLGDITLKEAMRKIPGIDIAETGEIKYLGKEISKFYIEGMDLLGGKYNIATNNIPASYVNTIQVLNNHQEIKMEKDIFSDNVAINIKLSPKAKFRPMGTYEATIGHGTEWLYQVAGSGMLFNTNFQSILTARTGNIEEFSKEENSDLIPQEPAGLSGHDIFGDLTSDTPPVDRKRYINPNDHSLSLNLLNRINQDATIKGNIGYGYSDVMYQFYTIRDYYNGMSDLIINQSQNPSSKFHSPYFTMEYKQNTDSRYISNTLRGTVSIFDSELPTEKDGLNIDQEQNIRDYMIDNDLNVRWRRGNIRWNLASTLQYASTPSTQISMTNESNPNTELKQVGRNGHLLIKKSLSGTYDFRDSRIYFPLSLMVTSDKIDTDLSYENSRSLNKVDGQALEILLSPQYEYAHPARKLILRCGITLRNKYYDYQNKGSIPAEEDKYRFSLNPNLYINFMPNAKSSWRALFSYEHKTGDALDMLISPIRTDYLSQSLKSGILSESKELIANLHYDFKIPTRMWFLNTDIFLTRSWNNQMLGQQVATEVITNTRYPIPNHSTNINTNLKITKQIQSIKSKISLRASYLWNQNTISQNGQIINYYGQNILLAPSLTARPWNFIELNYATNFSKRFSRYLNSRQGYLSQQHDIELSLFPIKPLEIRFSSDITREEISKGQLKTISLFDASIHYRLKSFRISLKANNILDQASYAYSIFSGLDRFVYHYTLRGREILLSIMFTK